MLEICSKAKRVKSFNSFSMKQKTRNKNPEGFCTFRYLYFLYSYFPAIAFALVWSGVISFFFFFSNLTRSNKRNRQQMTDVFLVCGIYSLIKMWEATVDQSMLDGRIWIFPTWVTCYKNKPGQAERGRSTPVVFLSSADTLHDKSGILFPY